MNPYGYDFTLQKVVTTVITAGLAVMLFIGYRGGRR